MVSKTSRSRTGRRRKPHNASTNDYASFDELLASIAAEPRTALVGSDPETFSDGWSSATTAWVTIRLDRIDADEVLELVAEAWRLKAPRKVIAAFDAAHPDGLP